MAEYKEDLNFTCPTQIQSERMYSNPSLSINTSNNFEKKNIQISSEGEHEDRGRERGGKGDMSDRNNNSNGQKNNDKNDSHNDNNDDNNDEKQEAVSGTEVVKGLPVTGVNFYRRAGR